MELVVKLLDIEKDLRECESALRCGCRCVSTSKCESWFDLMEELGFLTDGKFIPIVDIINKTKCMTETMRVFTLESVACDLSIIARVI